MEKIRTNHVLIDHAFLCVCVPSKLYVGHRKTCPRCERVYSPPGRVGVHRASGCTVAAYSWYIVCQIIEIALNACFAVVALGKCVCLCRSVRIRGCAGVKGAHLLVCSFFAEPLVHEVQRTLAQTVPITRPLVQRIARTEANVLPTKPTQHGRKVCAQL